MVVITFCAVYSEADSQLSSDTDFEDPEGKNAKTGRGAVCFSDIFIHFLYILMDHLFNYPWSRCGCG